MAYLLGLAAILGSAYSQYFVKGGYGPITGAIVIYGVPILVIGLLWGRPILRRTFGHTGDAVKYGLASYGVFTIVGIVAGLVIFYMILTLDPAAVNKLHQPNPVLHVDPELAWIMVGVSLLVIGPAEEFLFRGFLFGGLLSMFKTRNWLSLAFLSATLFAAAHLYYALVYGVTSLIQFAELASFGAGMAVCYYLSGGNLLVPALLHGTYDAAGFVGVATSSQIGALLRISMTTIGILVAVGLLINRTKKQLPTSPA